MSSIQETALYSALTSEAKDASAIVAALGSATSDYSQRTTSGQSFVHIAALNLVSSDFPEVWKILLRNTNMFTRDVNGDSGLDFMIDNLPVAWSNKYLKELLLEVSSSEEKVNEFMKHAGMNGKTVHLKRLAVTAKADKRLIERLSAAIQIDQEIMEIHKMMRVETGKRHLHMTLSKREQATLPDLVGLPSLQIATIHGLWSTVAALLEKFPEIVNCQDNMGRTALHYATCMKGDDAEGGVKLLMEANADATIKDLSGADIAALKAAPFNMEEILSNYQTNLDRQSASEMLYRVNDAVLSGNLRPVKMALTRRELASTKDASKLTPLHKAVILKHTEVAKWIAQQFPGSMDVQGNAGLTPMHFAAAVDKELYEFLKQAGGDCHTVDVEGNDPEYYKDHSSDFILNIDNLREELLFTPPSRPATAISERAKSAKAPDQPDSVANPLASAVRAPPVMASRRQAPPPETLDAKYIAEVLGGPLTAALSEVAEKRPWDPIEFLAQWLYKHKANLNYHQQQLDAAKRAEEEERRKQEEAENRARRKREAVYLKEVEEEKKKKAEEDARKQREQEELQKKAKESVHLSQPPELPTVKEDEETPEANATPVTPREPLNKDEQGRTVLHTLVASQGTVEDIQALLAESGLDMLAARDMEGKTARDLAESDEIRQCLDNYVVSLLNAGDEKSFLTLVENGFVPPESFNQEGVLSEEAAQLLAKSSDLAKLSSTITDHVRAGNLTGLKECIDKPSLAISRLNSHGSSVIHLAVLYEQPELVQHLVTSFPGITSCRDHQNRTALHYAESIASEELRDSIVATLKGAGADEEAEDCKGRKPQAYQQLTEEIGAMKEMPTSSTPQGDGPAAGEETAATEGGDTSNGQPPEEPAAGEPAAE